MAGESGRLERHVVVRPMAQDDVAFVAPLHIAAFPHFFLTTLGKDFLTYYYRMFPAYPETIALVAEGADRRIDGFVVGTLNPRGFYRRLLARHWMGFALRAVMALIRRPGEARRLMRGLIHPGSQPVDREVAGLFSIAVDPRVQGSRIGHALMTAFLARAAERGARKVVLQTDAVGNDPVNAFYRRHGFTVRRVYATPEGRIMNDYARPLETAGRLVAE